MDDEIYSLQLKAGILFFVLATTVIVYFRILNPPSKTRDDWKNELASTKVSSSVSTNVPPLDFKDVWGERRKRGITASSSGGKQPAQDRPFESSYYYAHNNPNAKGGYKDGLRMEDYAMNGPRLLSKGGVPVSEETRNAEDESGPPTNDSSHKNTVNKRLNAPVPKRISKFLWDDPGDSKGIATIRIDTLPGATLTETISWRQANITDVSVSLTDDKKGLVIEMTSENGSRYQLKIPKLHGEVEELKEVVKPNRLLVRVHKKKSWMNPLNRNNLKAWPHP